ncbi:pyocin knob domain-containing protein [Serratia fonticola]|uniref:pyocin knob domain-containing protein n=1 Tax=Serratia fonticola TaxID=47917 RepID=UPI002DBA6021|nr:pyocin knob domain-containing protein [Serratia fonticola]MEB7887524.1 pyocin knob domain-containing protein [Serratia fonticola]
MWYKTGTINLTANNATVTGTGTAWADAKFGVMPGMILLAPDNKLYEVKQVNSNTSLTLNSNYAGSTASGQSYAIITTYEGDISQFSARFAAMLTFFQGSRNDTVSWFTGSGDMTFTKDDGTKLTVPTLAKIQADYLSKTATADQSIAGPVLFSKAATFNNGSTSLGDNVFQAKTPGANVILRYKDMDGVEKGAIYVTSATGQMTQRWGGAEFSVIYGVDGRVTFPSDIYIGTVKVKTQSTSLGTQDLDNIKTDGDYYQSLNVNASTENHYPNAQAGLLCVISSRAGVLGRFYITQLYYPYKAADYFYQRIYDASISSWTAWDIYEARGRSDSRYLKVGEYGLGGDFRPSLTGYSLASDYRINGAFYANLTSMTDTFGNTNTHVLNVSGYTGRTHCFQLAFPLGSDRMGFRRIQNNGVGEWKEVWHTGNTTVDANGFLKKASPIARLSGNPEKMPDEYLDGFTLSGLAAVNGEAAGVTAERLSVGVYKVTGSLGFALEGWNIEVPQDVNGNRLCFVATEAAEDGTITVRVSKRRFDIDTAAIVAGEPMDIPEGRWIDLRLEMPPVEEVKSEPEPENHEGEMASE